MNVNTPMTDLRSRRTNIALWLIAIALLANAVVMAWPHNKNNGIFSDNSLQAQIPPGGLSHHGIYIMPAQLSQKSWGMVVVDTHRQVFCVYRLLEGASRLRLIAARNFRYDLRLKDFNNTAPTPAQIKTMVEHAVSPMQPATGKHGAK